MIMFRRLFGQDNEEFQEKTIKNVKEIGLSYIPSLNENLITLDIKTAKSENNETVFVDAFRNDIEDIPILVEMKSELANDDSGIETVIKFSEKVWVVLEDLSTTGRTATVVYDA